jgi:sulfur transfer complex TusBCD TusB component (DsrH family)
MHIHYNLSNLNLHLITASAYRDVYLTSNTQHLIMKSIKYSQMTRENEITVIVLCMKDIAIEVPMSSNVSTWRVQLLE